MATNKGFTRGLTQVLFRHLPEAIFEHDDYGLCKVTDVALTDAEVNRDALFDAMTDALAMWTNPRFIDKYPDPRNLTHRTRYAIGAPREVRFTPFPETFVCRRCERAARFSDLNRRGATTTGICAACAGRMTRLRYVQAHNCGRLEEIFLPRVRCPKGHGPEHLAFYDPGRVKQARWYCKVCKADLQALRMTPCKCAYNDSLPPGRQPEKWLKVVPTGDPSLYIPHTLAFINFPEDVEGQLKKAPAALTLMLGRAWGLLSRPVADVLADREHSSRSAGDPQMAALIEALRKASPDNDLVKKYDREQSKPAGQDAMDNVEQLLRQWGKHVAGTPRRWLIEHTTLLDRTDITDTEGVAAMFRHRGDDAGAADIENARQSASKLLGIANIRIINDFPLALCAYGYTRTSRDPSRTIITPFPVDDRGRIPVFAVSSETEALWFQLDPSRIVAWLCSNGIATAGSAPKEDREAWAWLYANVEGVGQSPREPAYSDPAAVAIRTLIHTMSHIFLRRIEWSGFAPSSVGEYLIPASLSFILYANRHAETKIGGLTTLYEQRLNTWIWDAVQSGQECIYDPICTDDGGTCAGCTHREHNCVHFNRELSRATLYSGPTPQTAALNGLLLQHGYWDRAWRDAPKQ